MNKDQDDVLKMYNTSYGLLKDSSTIYAANVPFNNVVDLLGDNIKAILDLQDRQTIDITGIAEDKKNTRALLEKLTYDTSVIMAFYATITNNTELRIASDYTRTRLKNARDNEIITMGELVYRSADANAAALAPYGLTAGMLNALNDVYKKFLHCSNKPRDARSGISEAATELLKLFGQTNALLTEQIDNGMELFRESHNDFYRKYFISRKLIKSASYKRALHAKFIDSKTRKALPKVSIIVDNKFKKLSWKKGTTTLQNLYEGSHVLKASLPRYQNIILNFNVIKGETTRLVIEMVKEG
ncbi:MAG: hypothetical protein ACHQNT_07765 [Bacteroidia bacterium]